MTSSEFLTFGCKRPDRLDIKRPLVKYLERHYGKEQASELQADMDEVSRRRTEVVAVSGGGGGASGDSARDIYASYYRALSVMETRFPISRDSDHAQIAFVWTAASTTRKRSKQMNIHFEKASVLFNIAAVLSQNGAMQNRDSIEGHKQATQYFQEAAGTFNLAAEVALKVENPKPTDLTSDFLTLGEKLMLAQGQECVFWRAFKDQKSPSTLSKVAKHASILYSEVLALIGNPFVKEELERAWQDLIQSKSWLFEALCQHHAAEDSKSREDIAVEISRMNQAIMLLQKLSKHGKFLTSALPNFIKELKDSVTQRLTTAEKDNASIYLKRVKPFNELPLIAGAQIAKCLPPNQLDASNEHLFSELIPEPITKALSRYSELVDRIIRQEIEKLNGATDEARTKMKQYDLPDVLDAVTATTSTLLPEALKKEVEEIEQIHGLVYLEEMKEQIGALQANSMMELDELDQELDRETAQDSALREQYGSLWNVSTSSSQNTEFRKHIVTYRENLKTAGNSDQVIEEKMNQHREKLASLTVQEVVTNIPKLEPGMLNLSEDDSTVLVANIRNCVFQLGSLSDERATLEDSMRQMKNQDNLLNKVVATGVGSHEDLFRTELEKYNPLKKEVEENLQKQKELLEYLTRSFNGFQQTFDIASWRQQTDTYFKDLKPTVSAFYDLMNNLNEGMRFYTNLKDAVDKLKQQCSDFILSRKFDREDRIEMLKAKERTENEASVALPPLPPPPVDTSPYTSTTASAPSMPPPVPSDTSNFTPFPPPPPVHSFSGSSSAHGFNQHPPPVYPFSGSSSAHGFNQHPPPPPPPDTLLPAHQPVSAEPPPSALSYSAASGYQSPNPPMPPPPYGATTHVPAADYHQGQVFHGSYPQYSANQYQESQPPRYNYHGVSPPPPPPPPENYQGHAPQQFQQQYSYHGAQAPMAPPPPVGSSGDWQGYPHPPNYGYPHQQ